MSHVDFPLTEEELRVVAAGLIREERFRRECAQKFQGEGAKIAMRERWESSAALLCRVLDAVCPEGAPHIATLLEEVEP